MGTLAKVIGYTVMVVVALAVLAAIFHSQNSTQPTIKSVARQSAPQPTSTVPITESTPEPEPEPNKPPSISIGQSFSVGYWSYRVNAAGWTSVLNQGFSVERANAAFLVVDISVENNDKSSSTLPLFHLMDSDGREYDETSAGTFTTGFFDPIQQLNPGVSKRGYIAFDVPPDRQYVLVASGGFESGEKAIVSLAAPIVPSETKPPEPRRSVPVQSSQPTPSAETAAAPEGNTAPAPAASPATPHDTNATSGTLCDGPINVLQNGTMVFTDLPGDRLHFTFDQNAWQLTIRRQSDGKQTLTMRSLKSGIQTECHMQWEIIR